ncbi:MAG: sigma factor [Anaerolineae bacterium]
MYEHYLTAIYRYVFYRVGDVAEAEDLTEMVFQSVGSARQIRSARGAVQRVALSDAHNVVIDRHRTHKSGCLTGASRCRPMKPWSRRSTRCLGEHRNISAGAVATVGS